MEDMVKAREEIKRFKIKFLFITESISFLILMPLVYLYLLVTSDYDGVQTSLLAQLIALSFLIFLFITYINDRIVFSPVLKYLNKFAKQAEISDKEYVRAQRRFFSLPFIHSIGSLFRWATSLCLALALFTRMVSLTPAQTFNVWIMAGSIPLISMALNFVLTEIFMQRILNSGVFPRIADGKKQRRITFQVRIIFSMAIIAIVPALVTTGYFMRFLEINKFEVSGYRIFIVPGAILCCGLLVALGMAIPLIISVKSRLRIMSKFLEKLSGGDLTMDKRMLAVADELTRIYQSIYFMKSNITEIINDIRIMTNHLDVSSKKISGITEHFSSDTQNQSSTMLDVTETLNEISAVMSIVWLGAHEQVQSLESLVMKIKDLSVTISDLTDKTSNMQTISGDITKQARLGEHSLRLMNESMGRIIGSSEQMAGIINIINDISDSINLLSLNASIEAARAGEFGRGFAVVANEISKLADSTAASVKKIDMLIKGNENEIMSGMTMVTDLVDRISKIITGIDGFNSMIESLSDFAVKQAEVNDLINKEIQNVKIRSELIQSSSNDQKLSVQNISSSIETINGLTKAIRTGSEEIEADTKEQELMAVRLKEKVGQFKLE